MLQENYFFIGIIIGILFFTFILLNLTFKFTNKEIFTGFIKIKNSDDIFAASIIALLASVFLIGIWIAFIPFILLYLIIL